MAEKTLTPTLPPSGPPPQHNWPVIRAYWLALPPEKRSFKATGERFGVTGERVGQIAKRDGWREIAARLDEERLNAELQETRKVILRTARARAERLERTLAVYDRVNDAALAKLPLNAAGEIDLEKARELPALEKLLSDMPGLFRMAELAAGEATDRVHVSEVQPVILAIIRIAVSRTPLEERELVIEEIRQATAGLIPLEAS